MTAAALLAIAAATSRWPPRPPTMTGRPAGRTPRGGRGPCGCASCGASSVRELSAVQTTVAERIYADELHGTETVQDQARVRSYAPLLAALESGSGPQVAEAVAALVYKPHWHIVRLRVVARRNGARRRRRTARARTGQRHAPRTRTHARPLCALRAGRPRLPEARDPLHRRAARPLSAMARGDGRAAPGAPAPNGATVRRQGVSYVVHELALQAFPSGALQAALFVPSAPSGSTCAALRLAAWGSVARHVEARLLPIAAHYADLASVVRAVTGGASSCAPGRSVSSAAGRGGCPPPAPFAGRAAAGRSTRGSPRPVCGSTSSHRPAEPST